jgi:uncharacterized membrane protein
VPPRAEASAGLQERLAATITRFSGSMRFVYAHALGRSDLSLDLHPLITQDRMAAAADRRAELDVQISLLAEAETAKLVELISDIAEQLNVRRPNMRKSRK